MSVGWVTSAGYTVEKRQLTKTYNTYKLYIYTVNLLMMGYKYARNM